MGVRITRGTSDETIEQLVEVLRQYESDHPDAEIELYRQNPASVRIRIKDDAFRGLPRTRRHELVWEYFDKLADEVQGDVSMLILVTSDETSKSLASLEFDDPVPSGF